MTWRTETAKRCLFSAVACIVLAVSPGSADTLRMGGTISGTPILREIGEAFRVRHSDVAIDLQSGIGSSAGIRGVMAGLFDLSIIARGLNAEALAANLREVPIGRTPLIMFVRASSATAQDITGRHVLDALHGRLQAWPDGRPMRLVLHHETDSLTVALSRAISGFDAGYAAARSRRGTIVVSSDQELMDTVERSEGALGYGTLTAVLGERRRLRLLTFDGIAPSAANVRNGAYPMTVTLRLVIGAAAPARVHDFIALTRSPEGARIMRALGTEPIDGGS